jgi:hypothetical protein
MAGMWNCVEWLQVALAVHVQRILNQQQQQQQQQGVRLMRETA